MKPIIGLGNPGEKYKKTRHNIGFRVVDALAQERGLDWQYNKKFKAEICWFDEVILAKPQTFMNNSDQAVQAILSFYNLLPKRFGFRKKNVDLSETLIVVHDDLDIELGKYKISTNAGSAGHKGVQSIIDYLKTKNFKRIRIGIHTDMTDKIPTEKFVLQKFSQEEEGIIEGIVEEILILISSQRGGWRRRFKNQDLGFKNKK